MSVAPLSLEEAARVADMVREHPHRDALSALAYTVLSRQAEGGSLFAGKKYMRQQAREHGITRPDANTPHGNLVQILERGPVTPTDFAVVGAFSLLGFDVAARDAEGAAADELVARFIAHLDWLTLATRYRLQPLIAGLLSEEVVCRVREGLCQAVMDDQRASSDGDAGARARVAARLALLERIDPAGHTARDLLADIDDGFIRRLLSPLPAAGPEPAYEREPTPAPAPAANSEPGPDSEAQAGPHPDPAPQPKAEAEPELEPESLRPPTSEPSFAPAWDEPAAVPEARVQARLSRVPGGTLWGVLRWLSGWALLSWVCRGLGRLVGVRRLGSFSLEPAGIRVFAETRAAGRVWGQSDEVLRLSEIRSGRRHVRYPALRRLVGLLSFCLGCLVGAVVLYDGLAVMERNLVLLGAGLIGAGCLLDLLFDVVLSGARGRVAIELSTRGRRFCLRDVPQDEADRFMDALARVPPGAR